MRCVNFAIGVHNHQPVGNPYTIFEKAYRRAYLPFLEVLEKHPSVKVTLHYSGSLLDWLLTNHPDFIERLKKLVLRGQAEFMTGGYYEPILAIIPDDDKVGQIKKLTQFIKEHLAVEPQGMWLAERVWEPHLAKPISEAGVSYTVLDDAIFTGVGLQENEMYGYYIVEEQGRVLNVFPINQKLRYLIPFQKPGKTIAYLRNIADENGKPLVVIADDGEKLGLWPQTYELVYEQGWLEEFFMILEENNDWIKLVTLSEYLRNHRPLGRIYLPTGSYREMMEWALPTESTLTYEKIIGEMREAGKSEQYSPYMQGGFWRNFLVKYPESNNMHKKMLYVNEKVKKLEEGTAKEEAKLELWRGQNNDAYWHGVFGGLYLNHLRSAIYRHLITAEKIVDEELHKNDTWIEVEDLDFDRDGYNEILINSELLNVYLKPAEGGTMFELDYKPRTLNLLDTLTRRPEAYHHKILRYGKKRKEQIGKAKSIHEIRRVSTGFEKHLNYDWYRRVSLIEHLLSPYTTLKAFKDCIYNEQGDFVNQPYQYKTSLSRNEVTVQLSRNGKVKVKGRYVPVIVKKTVNLKSRSAEIAIDYEVENLGSKEIEAWFGVEFNISPLANYDVDKERYYYLPGECLRKDELTNIGTSMDVSIVGIRDEWLGLDVSLNFGRPAILWRFPIETVSQSEKGLERNPQSLVLLPSWKILLDTNSPWKVGLRKKIENI